MSNHEEKLAEAHALLREVRLVIRQPLAMRLRNDLGNRIDQFLVSAVYTDEDSNGQIPDAL